jgi:hypothetical protein
MVSKWQVGAWGGIRSLGLTYIKTSLYIKQITYEDVLKTTGNSARNSVTT